MKKNRYRLQDEFFKIFDDITYSASLRDGILVAYFYSNQELESEILKRINPENQFFYRMTGMLRTSGGEKSINYLLNLLKNNDCDLNTKKSLLHTIYDITDRVTINNETATSLEIFLKVSRLDTLSQYALFQRD